MLSHIFSLFIVLGPYFGCQAVLGSRPYKNCSLGDLFHILGPQKITIFESGLKTLFHFIQGLHYLHFRLENSLKVKASTFYSVVF